jgi:hypothetical protein
LGDWLGTGTVAPLREYQSFKRARAFARNLGLKSSAEWLEYCRSGSKPANIPTKPYRTYAEAGWVSMGDWLGTNRRRRGADWRPFNKARAFARGLGLKSTTEWGEYCRSGKRPADIPAGPSAVYASDGWIGYSDWLGIWAPNDENVLRGAGGSRTAGKPGAWVTSSRSSTIERLKQCSRRRPLLDSCLPLAYRSSQVRIANPNVMANLLIFLVQLGGLEPPTS